MAKKEQTKTTITLSMRGSCKTNAFELARLKGILNLDASCSRKNNDGTTTFFYDDYDHASYAMSVVIDRLNGVRRGNRGGDVEVGNYYLAIKKGE